MLADICDIDLRISQGAPAQAVLAAADAIGLDRLADMMADESPQYRPVAVAASPCRIKLPLLAGERDAAREELARLRGRADQRGAGRLLNEVNILAAAGVRGEGALEDLRTRFPVEGGRAMAQKGLATT